MDTNQVQDTSNAIDVADASSYQSKTVTDNLRLEAQTLNLVGTTMLANPVTAVAGGFTLGLVANVAAEFTDPTSGTKSFRSAAIDVITSSLPGGFGKDVAVDITKSVLDFFAGD